MHTSRILVLVGGSRLAWMSVPVLFGVDGPANEALEIGWEDNGFVTGGIGLILLLRGLFWKGRIGTSYSVSGAVLAVLAVLEVLGCFQRILEINPSAGFFAATDIGIYVTLIGGLLAFVGASGRIPVRHGTQSAASSVTAS